MTTYGKLSTKTADTLKCSAVAGNMFETFIVSEILKFYSNKVSDKKRGLGVILCLIDKKTYLRENLVALPIEFI